MALKALLNNQPVMAWDVAGTGDFSCVECTEKMHYRRSFKRADGVWVTAHFAHNPAPAGTTPRACSIGQSEEHMNAKQTICVTAPDHFWWLRGIRGDVEVPLGQRRADVLFTRPNGRCIVFEPQFTKIPRSQIAERTKDYHALGCDVIWCFPEKRDDLYQWAKQHFYCVGQLSDDGNEVTFWGNLNPEKHAPGLRRQFDAGDPSYAVDVRAINEREHVYTNHFCTSCGALIASAGLCFACQNGHDAAIDRLLKVNVSRTMMRDSSAEIAYKAWMSAGNMGLSAWLASYKERQNGKRNYTVEEYGDWVTKIRAMELERTGENNEFCRGA